MNNRSLRIHVHLAPPPFQKKGDEIVCLIFGVVDRRGWALMKKGHERAFVISKNKIND